MLHNYEDFSPKFCQNEMVLPNFKILFKAFNNLGKPDSKDWPRLTVVLSSDILRTMASPGGIFALNAMKTFWKLEKCDTLNNNYRLFDPWGFLLE